MVRAFSIPLLAMLGLILAVPGAEAHAKLLQSSPAAGAVAAESPAEIKLTFNEAITPSLSHIVLASDKSSTVPTGPGASDPADPNGIVLSLPAKLAPGKYRVTWTTVSADMHKVKGSFEFTVGQ